jgi:hypothetical protein
MKCSISLRYFSSAPKSRCVAVPAEECYVTVGLICYNHKGAGLAQSVWRLRYSLDGPGFDSRRE